MAIFVNDIKSIPKEDSGVLLTNIEGKQTTDIKMAVARKSKNKDSVSFYIRTEGLAPVHHERFRVSNLMNPTLNKVDEDTYNTYLNYLDTKKEVFYIQVRTLMKSKGFI